MNLKPLIPVSGKNFKLFPALAAPWLKHGIFGRGGGVSPAPWDSLNVSYGVGDSVENVRQNRDRLKAELGLGILVSCRQVHGSRVAVISRSPEDDLELDGFDALITNLPGIGLMIQHADCQAILLADPQSLAVGIIHAGWRGSVAGIIGETVSAMTATFATRPAALIAAISPSLEPCCGQFVNYRNELPVSLHQYQVRPDYFDFWAISRAQLLQAGLADVNITAAGVCTVCDRDYFSYRRDRLTGRCGSVIGIAQ